MAKIVKDMIKRAQTTGCGSHVVFAAPISAISKIVDFIEAEPVGSALFLSSPCVILSGAKDPAFIS